MTEHGDRAYKLLELLQEDAFLRFGVVDYGAYAHLMLDEHVASFAFEDLGPDPAEVRSRIEDVLVDGSRPVRSKYQNTHSLRQLARLAGYIDQGVAASGNPPAPTPLLGTAPTGRVQAMTVRVEGIDEFVVLFEEQIFYFANLFAKAVSQALPVEMDEEGQLILSFDDESIGRLTGPSSPAAIRFREVVLAYALTGRPTAAPQYFLGQPGLALANWLRRSMEIFILGHEFGHVLTWDTPPTDRIIGPAWEQEGRADWFGLAYTIPAMQAAFEGNVDAKAAFACAGVDLFFNALRITDDAVSILRTGAPGHGVYDSHPPPGLRREWLRAAVVDLPPAVPERFVGWIQRFVRNVDTACETMWRHVEPELLRMHENGRRPATHLPTDP